MITLRHTVSALAVSTLLLFPACKKKESVSEDTSARALEKMMDKSGKSVNALSLKSSDLDKYFKVKKRNSSNGDAALSELGMFDGNDQISWGSRDGKNGNYVYKQVRLKAADGDMVAIKRMELQGVHYDGEEAASFDVMKLTGLSFGNEDGKGTIGSMQMARPHPKVAANILKGLSQLKELNDIDMNVELDGEQPFGAIKIADLDLSGDDGSASVDVMGWGSDEESGKSNFLVSNLKAQALTDYDTQANFSIKTISANGIDTELVKSLTEIGETGPKMNPFASGYGNLIIDDIDIKADALSLNMDGFQATTNKKGNIVTEKVTLQPLTIRLEGEMNSPEYADIKNMMSLLEIEEVHLTGGSTSVKNLAKGEVEVSDGFLSMKDGFDLNFSAKMSGISEDSANSGTQKINRANLEFTDHAIVDKALTFFGEQSGMTKEEMRQQAAAVLTFASLAGQVSPDVSTPLSKFINNGGTLSVEINPEVPLSMDALQTMADPSNLDELGVKLKHKK